MELLPVPEAVLIVDQEEPSPSGWLNTVKRGDPIMLWSRKLEYLMPSNSPRYHYLKDGFSVLKVKDKDLSPVPCNLDSAPKKAQSAASPWLVGSVEVH